MTGKLEKAPIVTNTGGGATHTGGPAPGSATPANGARHRLGDRTTIGAGSATPTHDPHRRRVGDHRHHGNWSTGAGTSTGSASTTTLPPVGGTAGSATKLAGGEPEPDWSKKA